METQFHAVRRVDRATSVIQRIRRRFAGVDLQFLTGSTLLTVGIAIARVLGFGFSMILTHKLTQADFGFVQYCIALGGIVAILTQPFAQHVLARFVSQYKGNQEEFVRFLNTAALMLVVLIGLTALVATPVLLATNYFNVGVVTVFIGITIFYVYYGAARGFIASYRLLAAYLGSNLVQIIAIFLVYVVFDETSPMPALLIYGLSYFLPLVVLQMLYPLPLSFRLALPSREHLATLVRFSTPIWLSHLGYMLQATLDVLLLERFWGNATVGAYAVTKTLTSMFNFVSMGITTILMPKVAETPENKRLPLLVNALMLAMAANGILLAIFLLTYSWFVGTFFQASYILSGDIVLIMAVAEIVHVIHGVITAYVVGGDHPRLETASRAVALLSMIGFGIALVPIYGIGGAAVANLLSLMLSVGTYGIAAVVRQKTPLAKQTV